jgi:hypothetical protein
MPWLDILVGGLLLLCALGAAAGALMSQDLRQRSRRN